jgi:WD40 repeat protein
MGVEDMASRSRNELFSVLMVGIIIVSGFLTTTVTSIMTDVDVLKNPSSDIDCISEINEELKVVQNNEKEDALVSNIESSTFTKIKPSKYDNIQHIYPSGSEGGYEGLRSNNPVSPEMENIIDHHYVEDAWLQGCNGSGVNVAVVDTGVDFAHIDLYGTQAKVGTSTIENETVITAKGDENWAYLAHGNIVDGSYTVYKNYVSMIEGTGNDYTLNLTTGNISFTSPLIKWDNITAYYHYYPAYYGWPIAYDPSSMAKFLKNNDTKETWYANTSVVGEGPFEVSHWINIDGTNDFAEKIESWGADPRDNVASGLGGDKEDYDLTDLYITRDSENWYVGFPTYCIEQNVTFGLLIDVDNETSGSVSTPEGKLVDTNTSHTNFVHDAAFSPDGSMIASLSKDKTVKVWMRDGSLFHNLAGHGENVPYSLVWSPNGSWLATVDQYEIIIWDVMSGEDYMGCHVW